MCGKGAGSSGTSRVPEYDPGGLSWRLLLRNYVPLFLAHDPHTLLFHILCYLVSITEAVFSL